MNTNRSITRLVAAQSIQSVVQEGSTALITCLFVGLVLTSAYLGWSATNTVNNIYIDAVSYLSATGQVIPTNPVGNTSPLSLLRNVTIYMSLIGALSSIVVGFQLIASDRSQGVLPLIGSRIGKQNAYITGKILALCTITGGLIIVAFSIAAITLQLLPAITLTTGDWISLLEFFLVSYAYLLFFGLISIASASFSDSESNALLIPMTIWISITFVLPSLTANIHPTAAINPISSLLAAPESTFFSLSSHILEPFSLAETFKIISASLLNYLPEGTEVGTGKFVNLGIGLLAALVASLLGLNRLTLTKGEFDV